MVTAEQQAAAQQMRREVKGLCWGPGCSTPLRPHPLEVVRMELACGMKPGHWSLCDVCFKIEDPK